jgi:hypothetical protein
MNFVGWVSIWIPDKKMCRVATFMQQGEIGEQQILSFKDFGLDF